MVRKKVYVQRKAEDLKTGDMFVHWAILNVGDIYPKPRIIINVRKVKKNLLKVILGDGRSCDLRPEMIVVVQEVT